LKFIAHVKMFTARYEDAEGQFGFCSSGAFRQSQQQTNWRRNHLVQGQAPNNGNAKQPERFESYT